MFVPGTSQEKNTPLLPSSHARGAFRPVSVWKTPLPQRTVPFAATRWAMAEIIDPEMGERWQSRIAPPLPSMTRLGFEYVASPVVRATPLLVQRGVPDRSMRRA